MVTVDPAPEQGVRNADSCFTTPDLPGFGVEPVEALLNEPVAVYR
jgi:hypothetical protein